jgi:hypothetical protein
MGVSMTYGTTDDWSLAGPDALLVEPSGLSEERLVLGLRQEVSKKNLPEKALSELGSHFASGKLGGFAYGKPRPEDIQVEAVERVYLPYWMARGVYARRYVRRGTYKIKVGGDVERVRINGQAQSLVQTRRTLGDLIVDAVGGSTIGVGPLSVGLEGARGLIKAGVGKALGSHDKEVSRESEITILDAEEIAAEALSKTLCFDANTGRPDPAMLDAIDKAHSFEGAPRRIESSSLPVVLSREQVVGELKRALVVPPSVSPARILEQLLTIPRLQLVYTPHFDISAQAKGQKRVIRYNPFLEGYTPV